MDVTAMLNVNTGAVEQQNPITKSSTKNRTPWDAGGYSMPLHTISGVPRTHTPSQSIQYDDTHTSTPTSPYHKTSDSRGSLSSLSSSFYSASHSRYSSLSTVGSSQPLDSLTENICESPSPRTVSRSYCLESGQSESTRPSTSGNHSRLSLSPRSSTVTIAVNNAKDAMVRRESEKPLMPSAGRMSTGSFTENESKVEDSVQERRPGSPSDSLLIKRTSTTIPSLKLITGDQRWDPKESAIPHLLSSSFVPLENHQQPLLPPRGHKRTLSEPGFIHNHNKVMASNRIGPKGQITPPTSQHPDNMSPISNFQQAPDTPPCTAADLEIEPLKCMYIEACDTGSQLRKAISHIFGRNKLCTRQIPSSVWVHYCRKHYQRSRYRNPKEYAKLQCDLVQNQIRRVHRWSQSNAAVGRSGVVQDWSMSVRKREQKRLDDLNSSSGRKRKVSTIEQDDEEDEEFGPNAGNSNISVPSTAVPAWLLDQCRKGYSTSEILEIFNRLHQDILEDKISTFPDIEILPNISFDEEEPKSPKGYTKRPQGGHNRAQSLNMSMKPPHASPDRRLSMQGNDGHVFPFQKRRRSYVSSMDSGTELAYQSPGRSRLPEMGRRGSGIAMHSRIDEHQMMEHFYNYSPSANYSPLPAPTPQRLNGPLIASPREPGHASAPPVSQNSRPHRSQSDMGSLSQSPYFREPMYQEALPYREQKLDPSRHGWRDPSAANVRYS